MKITKEFCLVTFYLQMLTDVSNGLCRIMLSWLHSFNCYHSNVEDGDKEMTLVGVGERKERMKTRMF